MKNILILLAAALPALAQQTFDFKTLDKLGANAKESTNVSLDSNTIKMAAGMLGDDKDAASLKSMAGNLKGIQVREYKYDAPKKYNEADLEPLRAWLAGPGWTKIIDVKDSKENTQMYVPGSGGGMAIVSAEPTQVTIVFINGNLNMSDLAKLGGNLGIPDITLSHGGKANSKTGDGKKD